MITVHNIYKVIILVFIFSVFTSCSDDDSSITEDNNTLSFLSEIRPDFFQNVNYESEIVVSQIPEYIDMISKSYLELEGDYLEGKFTSDADLNNMRIVNYYYSFYIISIIGAYLDGVLDIDDITGNNSKGYFSGISIDDENFSELEIQAMAQRSYDIATDNIDINGYNDKSYGFYVTVKQVYERAFNKNFTSTESNSETVDFAAVQLVDYDLVVNWNVLMSMVTFTNYDDPLNTFDNQKMEDLLFTMNSRVTPSTLPDIGGRYPEILGPIYRFDLNFKKVDWIMKNSETEKLSEEEIKKIKQHVGYMETVSGVVKNQRTELLDTWIHKYTFEERQEKLEELKTYINNVDTQEAPDFSGYLNTVNFKKAYQCYSCHASSGLLDDDY